MNGTIASTDDDKLVIRYSCHACGILDAEVSVRYREAIENVVAWMETIVRPALAQAHHAHSPNCQAVSANDVKIPVTHADYIGGPPLQ